MKGTAPPEVGASLLLPGAPGPLGIVAGPLRQMAAGFLARAGRAGREGAGGLGRGAAACLLASPLSFWTKIVMLIRARGWGSPRRLRERL